MTQQPETIAPNALLDYNNDNNLDDFFHDEQDYQQQEQRVVPAKLTADGISVTYSAPPLPSSPSPVMPSPAMPSSVIPVLIHVGYMDCTSSSRRTTLDTPRESALKKTKCK